MLVELRSVNKVFNAGEPNEVQALNNINFSIEQGEMVCLQGPSGSGKTTLLSIIGCIILPSSGYAAIGGKRISRLPDHFLTRYRREMIGFVFQDYNLLPHLTVADNVGLPLLPLGISPKRRSILAGTLLERFDLLHRRNFPITQLSGGEIQRVAIARALINDPPVIIADEPTAHLDARLVKEVLSVFAEMKSEGRTIILSSHDPAVAAFSEVDRGVTMVSGQLVAEGIEG